MTLKTITEMIDEVVEKANAMTDEQLRSWEKSQDCFDYLNR